MIDRCRVRSGAVLATGLLFIVGCGAGDDAINWTEHKSEGGNFSALFPQEAKEKKEGPGIEVLAASPSEGGSYSVMVQDLQEFEKGKEPKEIMDSYLKAQGDFMTVSDVEPTKAAGFPATRFKLADKKNPEAAAQSSLMIIAEGRQYIMSVITAADSHSDANVKKFFDSFAVLKKSAGRPSNKGAVAWSLYKSKENKFSVEMPGKPKVEENKVIVGDINTAELYVKASRVKLDQDSLEFNLQIASPSPPGYDVTSEKRIERDGFPARRVSAVGTKEQSDYAVESLGVYANGILYSAVIFGKKDIIPKMRDRFFDSFKIEKE